MLVSSRPIAEFEHLINLAAIISFKIIVIVFFNSSLNWTFFSDFFLLVSRLSLLDQKWTKQPVEQFDERYEHCAMLSSNKLYIFGGANKTENLNSVQVIDISTVLGFVHFFKIMIVF